MSRGVSAGAVKDIVPTAKVPGAVRSVQVDVGFRVSESTPHTCAVKPVLLAETTSTPVRVYPSSFEPVVNLCDHALLEFTSLLDWPVLLTRVVAVCASALGGRKSAPVSASSAAAASARAERTRPCRATGGTRRLAADAA